MEMKVVNIHTNNRYNVYDITYDDTGYPHFLIYRDRQWVRVSAKHFRPVIFADHYNELAKCGTISINLED